MEIALNLWKCVFPLVIAFPEEMKPSLICAQLYRWLDFLSARACVCLIPSLFTCVASTVRTVPQIDVLFSLFKLLFNRVPDGDFVSIG